MLGPPQHIHTAFQPLAPGSILMLATNSRTRDGSRTSNRVLSDGKWRWHVPPVRTRTRSASATAPNGGNPQLRRCHAGSQAAAEATTTTPMRMATRMGRTRLAFMAPPRALFQVLYLQQILESAPVDRLG